MSLQTRLDAVVKAIAADIKQLRIEVGSMTAPAVVDGGDPSTSVPDGTLDGGAP